MSNAFQRNYEPVILTGQHFVGAPQLSRGACGGGRGGCRVVRDCVREGRVVIKERRIVCIEAVVIL